MVCFSFVAVEQGIVAYLDYPTRLPQTISCWTQLEGSSLRWLRSRSIICSCTFDPWRNGGCGCVGKWKLATLQYCYVDHLAVMPLRTEKPLDKALFEQALAEYSSTVSENGGSGHDQVHLLDEDSFRRL